VQLTKSIGTLLQIYELAQNKYLNGCIIKYVYNGLSTKNNPAATTFCLTCGNSLFILNSI